MILTNRFLKLLHFLTVVFSWQILPSMQSSPWKPLEHPRGHWPVTWWQCSPYRYKQLPQVLEQASPYLLSVHSKQDNKHVLYQMSYHVKSFLFEGEGGVVNFPLGLIFMGNWLLQCKTIYCFVMHSLDVNSCVRPIHEINKHWFQRPMVFLQYEECIKQKVHRPHLSPEIHCLAKNKP